MCRVSPCERPPRTIKVVDSRRDHQKDRSDRNRHTSIAYGARVMALKPKSLHDESKLVAGGRIIRFVNCIGSPTLSQNIRHVSAQRAAAASRFERRRAGAADGTVIPPGQIAARLAWSTAKSSTLNPPALRLFRLHSAWKGASSVNITDCSNKLPGYWRVIDSLRSCLSAPVRWRFPKD